MVAVKRWALALVLLAACGSDRTDEFAAKQVVAAPTTTATPTVAAAPTTTVAPTTQPPPTTAAQRDVLKTAGRTKTDTDLFTVQGVWQIACKVTGSSAGMGVTILTPDGKNQDYFTFPPGDSVSMKRQGGTFYLEITPFGSPSWDCTVTDLPG